MNYFRESALTDVKEELRSVLQILHDEALSRAYTTFAGVAKNGVAVRSAYIGRVATIREIMDLLDVELRLRKPEEILAAGTFAAEAVPANDCAIDLAKQLFHENGKFWRYPAARGDQAG